MTTEISRQELPRTPESLNRALTTAAVSTIEALKGHLEGTQRTFYEGLLENLNGASAWFSQNKLKLTSGLILAATFLTSCAPPGAEGKTSQEILLTAQALTAKYQTQTAQPTTVPIETSTPTETTEPRVPPLAMDEIFTEVQIEVWEIRGYGGYFSGQPELEKPEQYIYIDLSHEGQVRIVESQTLDKNSWGLYYIRERKLENGGVIPITMLTWFIAQPFLNYGREAEIVWGDFNPGTTFFVSDEALYQNNDVMPEEDLKRTFMPIGNPRFTCKKVDTVYNRDGKLLQKPGTACEYTG